MRKLTTAFLVGSMLAAGVMAAPSLYAQGSHEPSGSMMGHGMMRDKSTKDEGEMMGMMKQMSQMMDHCSNMMSDSRPNDQWRKGYASGAGEKRMRRMEIAAVSAGSPTSYPRRKIPRGMQ